MYDFPKLFICIAQALTVLILLCVFSFQILWKVRHCCLWEIRRYFSLSLENLLVSLSYDKIFSTICPLRSKYQWTFCIRKEKQTPPQTVVYGTMPCSGFGFSLFTKSVYILLHYPALLFPLTYSIIIASDISRSHLPRQIIVAKTFLWPTSWLFPILNDWNMTEQFSIR